MVSIVSLSSRILLKSSRSFLTSSLSSVTSTVTSFEICLSKSSDFGDVSFIAVSCFGAAVESVFKGGVTVDTVGGVVVIAGTIGFASIGVTTVDGVAGVQVVGTVGVVGLIIFSIKLEVVAGRGSRFFSALVFLRTPNQWGVEGADVGSILILDSSCCCGWGWVNPVGT